MDLNILMEKYKEEIDKELKKYFKSPSIYTKVIFDSMEYSLFAGGKRLRPILMMLVCEVFGKKKEEVLPYACAMEMIHTYSLIHDDLPLMDNDDYRRGKLTNHKVFGEGIAALSGDGLLNLAFEIMIDASLKKDKILGLKIMEVISHASGIRGMIGGQVADLLAENKKVGKEHLLYIHENKTGALITASMVSGAIMGQASFEEIEKIKKIAYNIGLAFQIQDDILDLCGDEEKIGKAINSDAKNNKSTYLTIVGLDESRNEVLRLSEEAVEILQSFGERGKVLIDLTKYLIYREN